MHPCVLDHITVTAANLEAGASLVERTLGVRPDPGGEHPRMGTHNLLLRLGDAMFLEVIAVNPLADRPNRPRWFALDAPRVNTAADLQAWVVRTESIAATLDGSSEPLGTSEAMHRGAFRWRISIPADGGLPLDGTAPALVEWETSRHPAETLPDRGLSLIELQLYYPEARRLRRLLDSIGFAGPVTVSAGSQARLVARIQTGDGIRELGEL